jgi:hypothetical protein
MVVGTPGVAPRAGSAYVYDLSSPSSTMPVATLKNPSPAWDDIFGNAVAISGTRVVVGARRDDTAGTDEGSVYVFGPSPYSLWKVSALNNQFAADLGDGDNDGLGNLGEYGLLRSPTTPEGEPFSAVSAPYLEGERLRLFVPRDPARNDITLEVQATGDLLGPWTTIATSTLGAPFTGPGYFGGDSTTLGVKSVEIRDTVNVTDAPQRFLRVRVRH